MFLTIMVILVLLVAAMLITNYIAFKKFDLKIESSFTQLETKSVGLLDKINSYAQSMIETIFYISNNGQGDVKLNLGLIIELLHYHMKLGIMKASFAYGKQNRHELAKNQTFIDAVVAQLFINKHLIDAIIYLLKVCSEHSGLCAIALRQEKITTREEGLSEQWTFNAQTDVEFLTKTIKKFIRRWIHATLTAEFDVHVYLSICIEINLEKVRIGVFDDLSPIQDLSAVDTINSITGQAVSGKQSVFYTFNLFASPNYTYDIFKYNHNLLPKPIPSEGVATNDQTK